jgi:hypothetical protein
MMMAGMVRFRYMLLLVTMGALAGGFCRSAAAQESDAAEPHRSTSDPETGFYLGAHGGSNYMKLEFDERAALPSRGVTWDPWGPIFGLAAGYAFGPGFRAELSVEGSGYTAHPKGTQAGFGGFRLTGYVPVITRGTIRPHLVGGLSGNATIFHSPGMDDLSYGILGGEGGAGVRAILGRHWSLQADYVHTVLDLALEFVSKSGGNVDPKNVGRRGRMETVRVGVFYDF